MDHIDYYANAIRAEPGVCWRMVSRGAGYRVDTPTDCPEPVRWVGRTMVGRKRMRLWSCCRHVEGLAQLHAVESRRPGRKAPGPECP